MFGSKQLLIAFFIGVVGQGLVFSSLIDILPAPKFIICMIGLGAIWVSALFGPLFVMQEKGVTKFSNDGAKDD